MRALKIRKSQEIIYKELNYTWQDPKLNMPPQYVPSTTL